MLWGISTEWWILYLLIFVFALSICIFLGLITTIVYSACRAAEECSIRSIDIPNIYKLILDNKNRVEGSKADRNENIEKKFLGLRELISKIVSILETDQTYRAEISKAVSDINSEICRGIQFNIFKKKP